MDGVHVVLHVDEYVFVYLDIFKFFIALLLDPRVLVRLLSRQPHVRLPLQELRNEVLGLVRDFLPDWRREAVLALEDVLDDFLV